VIIPEPVHLGCDDFAFELLGVNCLWHGHRQAGHPHHATSPAGLGGDVAIVSVHWGSNWGYAIAPSEVTFAHRLIDAGIDIVHGHSSHHPRPIEIYRGKPILYGCGDVIDDYEGIGGHESFRGDLRLLYLTCTEPAGGELISLRMIPVRLWRMRLERASQTDAEWLRTTIEHTSRRFGTRVAARRDDLLEVVSVHTDPHPRRIQAGVGC